MMSKNKNSKFRSVAEDLAILDEAVDYSNKILEHIKDSTDKHDMSIGGVLIRNIRYLIYTKVEIIYRDNVDL